MKKFISMLLCIATVMSVFTFSGVTAGAATVGNTMPFIDVEQIWYYSGVEFCYANGIVSGTSDITFEPNTTLTRAMLVMMLAKSAGADLGTYTEISFSDVTAGSWYAPAVEWAYQNKVTNGTGEGRFAPELVVNREQLCSLMYNYMNNNGIATDITSDLLDEYTDKTDISSWAMNGVAAAVNAGLVTGTSTEVKLMSPKKNLVRSEASRVVYLLIHDIINGDCEHVYADATCTEAQTCNECGMKNGMPVGHEAEGITCADTEFICTVCEETVDLSRYNIHTYIPATCTEAAVCTACGVTYGTARGHRGTTATCTAPSVCSVCNITLAPAKGHKTQPATCTADSVCRICNTVLAKALGHTTDNGKCTRCGAEIFRDVTEKVKYYLKKDGYMAAPNQYTSSVKVTYDDENIYDIATLFYDADNDDVYMIYSAYFNDEPSGATTMVLVQIPDGKKASSYSYEAVIFDDNDEAFCQASGTLLPHAIKDGMYFVFDNYQGPENERYDFNMMVYYMLIDQAYYIDYILDDLCGADITAYGFLPQ